MNNERGFESLDQDIQAGDYLTDSDIEELKTILENLRDGSSIEEMRDFEVETRRKMAAKNLRSSGKWMGQNIIDDGPFLVDSMFGDEDEKRRRKKRAPRAELYTTDVVKKDFFNLKDKTSEVSRRIFRHFYKMDYLDYCKYGYSFPEVGTDLVFLAQTKKRLGVGKEDEGVGKRGRSGEDYFSQGIVLGDWLGTNNNREFEIGTLKHTLEFDDYVNHIDYYCPFRIGKREFPVGFDMTTDDRLSIHLRKLEQTSSSEGNGMLILPFGCGIVKYFEMNGETGRSGIMPLFKIALGVDEWGEYCPPGDISKDNVMRSLKFLGGVHNEKIISQDEISRVSGFFGGQEISDDEEHVLRKINIIANRLHNLRSSFFVQSEIFEQCNLILARDKKNKSKKFFSRALLREQDVNNIEAIRGTIWNNLRMTMRRIIQMNGEEAEFDEMSDEEIYEKFKVFAGVYKRKKDKGETREHYLGLRMFKGETSYSDDCYVNMMRATYIEKTEVVCKRCKTIERGGELEVTDYADIVNRSLLNSSDRKKTAREIFSTIMFDSYVDNFDELFELARRTETVKIFLARLGMGRFSYEKGIFEGGYVLDDDARKREAKPDDSRELHDYFIETLFSDGESREKYLSGRNKAIAVEGFSNNYLLEEKNLLKLVSWEVPDGKMIRILTEIWGLKQNTAQNVLDRIKQSVRTGNSFDIVPK